MKKIFKKILKKRDVVDELPEFEFDSNYERVIIKPDQLEQSLTYLDPFHLITKKASLITTDEEYVKRFRGFERYCRDEFLYLLSRIKLQKIPKLKVKFLFMDLETSILFRRLITWLEIKESHIACLFILSEDKVSNYLTQDSSLFYIVSMNYLNSFEKEFLKELKERQCLRMKVFLREQRHLDNEEKIEILDKIKQLTKNDIFFLSVFLPINESVLLIDNSTNTLEFLIHSIKSKLSFNELELINKFKIQKYSNHLAYVLFKNKLYPSIRYMNYFNKSNQLMAESTFMNLQNFYKDQDLSLADSNCLLLILDRSIDFLTPLLHSNNYYQFVTQELENVLVADFITLNERLEDATLRDVAEKLISISKKLNVERSSRKITSHSLSQLALFERKADLLSKHIAYVNEIRNQLKDGYQHFITIESNLLNKEHINEIKLIQESNKDKSEKSEKSEKSLANLNKNQQSPKETSQKEKSKEKSPKEISPKETSPKEKSSKEKLSNLNELDQKQFMDYLKKIFKDQTNLLDWKRFLFIYSIMREPLNKKTIKQMKEIITKETLNEINNFIDLIKKIREKNKFEKEAKFINIKSLINKIQLNELDESKYPFVDDPKLNLKLNPSKILIFVTGGISFNELDLVKKQNSTNKIDIILISDLILYPKLFLNTIKNQR